VSWAIEEKSYSQAKACALLGLSPKTYRYVSKRESDDAVRKRLRELAQALAVRL
jgi:putative transposase